jgi:chitinase
MLTLPCRHGSWDSPQDQIGSFVFGHTNKTEIEDSLNLFWRNGVPADKINLGIGFYGRSYTLEDKSCTEPGCGQMYCKFSNDSPHFDTFMLTSSSQGQAGVLSFDEIETLKRDSQLSTVYDEDAEIKYMVWNDDQWVSYDDEETLQKKVDFANKQGLLGLFVW